MEIDRLEECAKSSLVTAIHDGRLDDVKELVPLSNLSKQEQFYCLFNALFYDQRAITTYFLQKGFEFVNPPDRSSSSPFRLAVFNPNIELIDMLLKNTFHHSLYPKRSYVNPSSCSASPLLFLAFRGRANEKFIHFFESLLSQTDAELGHLLKTSLTPDSQQPAILLQTFLEYASAVIKISDFSSLLYLAFSRGNESIVKLLLHRICAEDLLDLLETILTDNAFEDWRPQLFQAILEYGSADIQFVGAKFVQSLFEILNRCVVLYPHIHLLSNCPLSRVFNDKDTGTAEILAKHAVKLKTAGLYKEQLPVPYCSSETMCNFQRRCEEEVADMKCEYVRESSVTFHDVLTQGLNRLALMAKNDQVERVLSSSYVEARFPIYSGLIRNQFEKGRVRRVLLEQSINTCKSLLGCFSDLPYELIEKIFGYLGNVDLRVMVYPRGSVGKETFSKDQTSNDHS